MPIIYSDPVVLYTLSKEILKIVEDFKYLGSRTASSEKDIAVRKALAWKALNKLDKIWKYVLSDEVKLNTFTTLIESILLYGCESWTLTQTQTKRLDGCYTRMLRKVLNKSWKDHGKISNSVLYGKTPRLTSKIRGRRLELAGHLYRHRDEEVGERVLFWSPTHGQRPKGRPSLTQ